MYTGNPSIEEIERQEKAMPGAQMYIFKVGDFYFIGELQVARYFYRTKKPSEKWIIWLQDNYKQVTFSE